MPFGGYDFWAPIQLQTAPKNFFGQFSRFFEFMARLSPLPKCDVDLVGVYGVFHGALKSSLHSFKPMEKLFLGVTTYSNGT